jgi:tetrahydromethanopterin S-methyltransferase subunit B
MSDMSFKQAKELVEKIELTEVSLQKTVKDIEEASKSFTEALRQQKIILDVIPSMNSKLGMLKILVAVNFGFLLGLVVGKYIL